MAERDRRRDEMENEIRPRGTLRIVLNAQSLARGASRRSWIGDLKERIDDVHIKSFSLRHTVQARETLCLQRKSLNKPTA